MASCLRHRAFQRWAIGLGLVAAIALSTFLSRTWQKAQDRALASQEEVLRIGLVQGAVVQDVEEIKIQVKRTDGSIDEILGYVRRGEGRREAP